MSNRPHICGDPNDSCDTECMNIFYEAKDRESVRGRIIKMCGIIPERIWNIYMYGSRVYGTDRNDSDYDFLVAASSIDRHKEINDGEYNIHIWTLDAFMDKVVKHEMLALECVYAPPYAVIMQRKPIELKFNMHRLKSAALSQSHNSWANGKMKLKECDIFRGQKSIFHSLRILDFAKQILNKGKIVNFYSMNHIWKEIEEEGETEWAYYRRRYLPLKFSLEHDIKEYGKKDSP